MIKLDGHTINCGIFPNGETYMDIEKGLVYVTKHTATIELHFQNNDDLIHLKFLRDYLVDELGNNLKIKLVLPYIPYSRMDRKENNRVFSLKSFANFINSMNFDSVEVWEPHSDVSVALIDKVQVINKSCDLAYQAMMEELGLCGTAWLNSSKIFDSNNDDFSFEGLIRRATESGIWFVYPDAGAEKRYSKQIKYKNYLTCTKHRDFDTGKITSFQVNVGDNIDKSTFKTAIIVDDLCSKGGTFIGTAEKLRELGFNRVILVVTHCENTIYLGDIPNGKLIDLVYTTNSILDTNICKYDKIKVYE